jgi:hypothetical protein
VYPFSTGAPISQKAATAIVDLALGIAIGTLLATLSARAVRREVLTPPGDPYHHDRYEQHPPTQPMEYDPSRIPGN